MNAEVEVRGILDALHPSFAGHFPGAPLAAGVVVLGRVLRAFRETHPGLRVAGIPSAKFPGPMLPGDAYSVRFARRGASRIGFECRRAADASPQAFDQLVARGELEVEAADASGTVPG